MMPLPLLAAFRLAPEARLDLRIPKKLLIARAKSAEGDSKLIESLVERAEWHAAIRPGVSGILAYADESRDYPEIALVVLALSSRPGKTDLARLQTLLHAAVPKPLVLLLTLPEEGVAALSLAPKIRHARERDRRVAAPPSCTHWFSCEAPDAAAAAFLSKLAPLPSDRHLAALYDRWMIALTDLAVALRLGESPPPPSQPATAILPTDPRPALLAELTKVDRELTQLRSAIGRAKNTGERSTLMAKIQACLAQKTSLESKLR